MTGPRVVEGREMGPILKVGPDLRFEDVVVSGCSIDGGFVGNLVDVLPPRRPIVQNLEVVRCRGRAPSVAGAVLEEVVFDGSLRDVELDFCAFRHVTISGRVPKLKIWSDVRWATTSRSPAEFWESYVAANEVFHRDVDWVLDVSAAELGDSMVRDLPFDKIVIDPDRQAIVDGARVLENRSSFADLDLEVSGIEGRKLRRAFAGDDAALWSDPLCHVHRVKKRDREQAEAEQRVIRRLHEAGCALPVFERPGGPVAEVESVPVPEGPVFAGGGYDFTLVWDTPVAEVEWEAMVDADPGLRRQVVGEPVPGAFAWVFGGGERAATVVWVPSGSVLVRPDIEDGDDLVELCGLAERLGARLRGESGEFYRDGRPEGM